MIKEAYVSFEIAKLLKEKGFDEPTLTFYIPFEGGEVKFNIGSNEIHYNTLNEYPWIIAAPTHQMACAWLREVHKLHISVDVSPLYGKVKDEKGRNTCGLLYWHYMASGKWLNEKYNPNQKAFVVSAKSYEEAIESALKYTLENLI